MTDLDEATGVLREAAELERAGRNAEAIAAYERGLRRWPHFPDSWYNLGRLLRFERRYDAALAAYQQALDLGVAQPEEAHLNRGVIYADHLRRDDLAEAELRAALRLNPAYVPALLNLGNLAEDLGRRDEARTLYERILSIDPGCHAALARLAGVAELAGRDDPLLVRLSGAMERSDIAAADRAVLGFALGRALDASGDYDGAFGAYQAANRASRASMPTGARGYDRTAQERYVDALIAAFGNTGALAPRRPAAPRPIFVCGMFRSGSTLAEQVLAAHPQVASGGELDLLPAMVRNELAPFPASMAGIPPGRLVQLGGQYLQSLQGLYPGAGVVTDKRPDNFLYIGLIKQLLPDARIVHTVRNPLDNCLSVYFLHLDHGMSYALDLLDIGHYYRQYRRLMAHWRSLYGADILDFDYDEYVREPRPAVERLLGYCGLEWCDACLERDRVPGAVKTASVWQVRQPLYRASSGRWRNYARQLAPLRSCLGDLLPEDAERVD